MAPLDVKFGIRDVSVVLSDVFSFSFITSFDTHIITSQGDIHGSKNRQRPFARNLKSAFVLK